MEHADTTVPATFTAPNASLGAEADDFLTKEEGPILNASGIRASCASFESSPRAPPANELIEISRPWPYPWSATCKLFVQYANGERFVCSGSLVGRPYILATARHCTWDACLGEATRVDVECGYGYTTTSGRHAHFGTASGYSNFYW